MPIPTMSQAIDSRVEAGVARRLFGDDSLDIGGKVISTWSKTVECLLFRRYENHMRRFKTKRNKSEKEMVHLDNCLKGEH